MVVQIVYYYRLYFCLFFHFFVSYFVEIFKINGPLHPMDPQLLDSLQILPEENKKLIDSFGGLSGFLMASSLFRTYSSGTTIGLKQDRVIIAETLETTHSTSTCSNNGFVNNSSNMPPTILPPRFTTIATEHEIMKRKERMSLAPSWSCHDDMSSNNMFPLNGSASLADNIFNPMNNMMNPIGVGDIVSPINDTLLYNLQSTEDMLPSLDVNGLKNVTPLDAVGTKKKPLTSTDIPGPSTSLPKDIAVGTKKKPSDIPGPSTSPPLQHESAGSKNKPSDIPGPIKNPPVPIIKNPPVQGENGGSKNKPTVVHSTEQRKETIAADVNGDLEDFEKMEKLKKEKMTKQNEDLFPRQSSGAYLKNENGKKKEDNEKEQPLSSMSKKDNGDNWSASELSDNSKNHTAAADYRPFGTGSKDYTSVVAMVTNDNDNGVKTEEKTMVTRGVNTDPLPHVDNYRDRYDETMKEKKSLEGKLEVSEDRMVRMQKQHGHELEIVEKKTKHDCNKV